MKCQYFFMLSHLFQNYEYLVFIPSIYVSTVYYRYYLTFVNTVLTIIIGSLIISVDYDYSFSNEDVLQKNDSPLNLVSFYLDSALCVVNQTEGQANLVNQNIFQYSLGSGNKKVDIFCRQLVESMTEKIKITQEFKNSEIIFAQQSTFLGNSDFNKNMYIKQIITSKHLVNQDALLDDQSQNSEAVSTIAGIYQDVLRSKHIKDQLNEIDFSYLTYIATINKNPYAAYLKITNARTNHKFILSIKDQQKLQNIMTNNVEKSIKFQNRKEYNHSEFKLYNLLQFEEEIASIQLHYCECLSLYKTIVQTMMMKFIEINQLQEMLSYYMEQRNKLESKILKQLKYNHNSETLKNICINFDFYLLHKNNLLDYYQKQNRNYSQEFQNKEYYYKSSCLAFVSLLDQSFGIVKNVNSSFFKKLGFLNKQQIQGKSFFQLFPQNNSQDQSQQLKFKNKLLSPIINNKIQSIPLFLAKHQIGYCVPFQLKIQSQILDKDFGLAIWANPIKEDSIYLALDCENPNIIQMANKLFYKKYLKENYKNSLINQIKTESLIPIIHHLINFAENQKEQKFQTVFILPNQGFQQEKYLLSDPNFLNNLKYVEIFSATVSLYFQSKLNQLQTCTYLIIEKIIPQKYQNEKMILLKTYQQQIQDLCNIELQLNSDFEEDYRNSLKSIIQIQQDDDFSNQNVNQFQIQKHLSIQNDKRSSTNILFSTPTNQESLLYPNIKESNLNNENIKKKNSSNQIILLSNSPRLDPDQQILSTSRSKTQLILSQTQYESFDTFQQLYNKQQTFQDIKQQQFQSSIIQEQLVKLNLQKANSSKNILSDNLNKQSSKQIIDCFTPYSSNRKLIQTTISSQQIQEMGIQANDKKFNKKWLEQEENKQLQNVDIQQLSSSSKSSKSKEIFENMHKKKQMWYLTVINILGIASILVTIALTLQGFFVFLTSLISQRENFKYINWIYMTNIEISYSISERNVYLLNRYNLMSTPPSQYQNFMDTILSSLQPRIKLSKQQVQQLYNNTDSRIQVFNIIQDKYIDQFIYSSPNVSQKVNLSIIYSILMQISNLYYFASNNDPTGMMKKQNEMNFQAINEQVQLIFSEMNDLYENQLTQIQNQSLLQLYIITIIMLTFLISKIPTFIYSKKKEQQILKLFATFDREQLREILTQIKNQLEIQTFDQKGIFSKFEFKFSRHQILSQLSVEEKKLNISQTSTLKYSIRKLLVGLIITFCLVIIYPILNYIIVRQFIDNSRVIYNFNNAVCVSYFIVQNSLRARHSLAMAYLVPFEQARPIQYYQNILNQLTPQVRDLPNLLKNNLEKVTSTNLYNQEIFKDYLINVFTSNACDTIKKYSQYQNGDFQYNNCISAGKGSLNSGLLNGLMFFFSIYMDYTTFAFSPDVPTFKKFYDIYHKNVPAYKQFQLKIEVSKELEYLLNFFQEQNLQLYNYYEKMSIILVTVQICIIIIIFTTSWYFYFKSINKQIFSTKQLLNIFPYKTLKQNTYVMSFLNQKS
ncbi:hypothetical protein ABPG74_016267 [Tetrahymena malaccensis]